MSRRACWATGLVLLLVTGGTLWLRWPTFNHAIWNLDEAIHAAIARTLLDGGVLYRDAIDQRTPLTYYVMAGIFWAFGANNLWAVHLFIALLLAATTVLLSWLMRRWTGWCASLWVTGLYLLLSIGLYYQGDANAFVTEWFVAFFSTAAACLFWAPVWRLDSLRWLTMGALLSCSFLSKQPGLLDLGAPLLTSAWVAYRDGTGKITLVSRWGLLMTGWLLPVAAVMAYFALHGAFNSFVFYAWTYNLRYYGPEIGWPDRLASLLVPFRLLLAYSSWLSLAMPVAVLRGLYRLAQRQPTAEEQRDNPAIFYLLVWALGALAAGAAGGRGFDHYFIQLLPAISLGLAWLLGRATESLIHQRYPWWKRIGGVLMLAALLLQLAKSTIAARNRTLPVDPSERASNFIRTHSKPEEKIFVWGYHPDIYLLADRKPASRFVYASFLSGLIPWSNIGLETDTAYAVVPGAMDDLLLDLNESRPTFIVDCSAGLNRFWQKYPLEKFPRLNAWIEENYVLADPGQFVPQGFRLFLIKDASRRHPPVRSLLPVILTPSKMSAGIYAPHFFEVKTEPLPVGASDPEGRLCQMELLVDGALISSVSFPPCHDLNVTFKVPFNRYGGNRHFQIRAVSSDGRQTLSAIHETDTRKALLSSQELAAFSLPIFQVRLIPVEISAPFGAQASLENDISIYFAHAPSRIRYALPAGAHAVKGAIGFRPGAYAPTNPTPTDGAEFRVEWIRSDGYRTSLYHRLVQPLQNPADRGLLPFRIMVPPGAVGDLEFVIDPGPAGNASSDWTYWADLALETSR